MGAPSGCSVSVPVTRVAGESGALRSVVPCADHPPAEGETSKSSWPTVWPSSWMVNLPLSEARAGAFFCAWEDRELNVRRHAVTRPIAILDCEELHIMERLPGADASYKVCHSSDAKR